MFFRAGAALSGTTPCPGKLFKPSISGDGAGHSSQDNSTTFNHHFSVDDPSLCLISSHPHMDHKHPFFGVSNTISLIDFLYSIGSWSWSPDVLEQLGTTSRGPCRSAAGVSAQGSGHRPALQDVEAAGGSWCPRAG